MTLKRKQMRSQVNPLLYPEIKQDASGYYLCPVCRAGFRFRDKARTHCRTAQEQQMIDNPRRKKAMIQSSMNQSSIT